MDVLPSSSEPGRSTQPTAPRRPLEVLRAYIAHEQACRLLDAGLRVTWRLSDRRG